MKSLLLLKQHSIFKYAKKTVRRLISSDKLIASRVGAGNRSLRIKKSDIDDYLAKHVNKTKGATVNE